VFTAPVIVGPSKGRFSKSERSRAPGTWQDKIIDKAKAERGEAKEEEE